MIKKQNSTFDDTNPNLCKLHIIITNSYKTIFTWKYYFVMQVNPFDCGWPLMLPMHQISSWVGFVSLVKQKMKDKLLMRLRLGNHVFQPKWWSFPKTNQVAWLSKPNQTLSWNEMWKYQKQHESGKTKNNNDFLLASLVTILCNDFPSQPTEREFVSLLNC